MQVKYIDENCMTNIITATKVEPVRNGSMILITTTATPVLIKIYDLVEVTA